jgi:hypothetical protein
MKKCYRCQLPKPLDDFPNRKEYKGKYKDGKDYWCKDCERDHRRFFKYGITSLQYDEILIKQEGKCAICKTHESELSNSGNKKFFPLCIDHSHSTKKVRGLLCHECNRALGLFKDKIEIVKEALVYLQSNE